MNTVLVIVLAIFAFLIIAGYFRGLIKVVFGTVMTILAIVVAYALTPVISTIVCDNTNVDDYFEEKIFETVEAAIGESIGIKTDEIIGGISGDAKDKITEVVMNIEPTKTQQDKFIDSMDIPDFAKKMIKDNNNKEARKSLGVNNFYHFISAYIAKMIVNAISFLGMFIIVYIIAKIVTVAAGILSHLPIIHGANKIGGALFGAVEALIVVWILFVVIAVVINTDFGKEVYSQIEANEFLTMLYDGNMFLPLVTKIV